MLEVTGDKRLDVIQAGSVRVLLGDGAGNFKPAPNSPFATAPGTWRLVAVDVNQDNKPDIVTSNTDSSSVTVLLAK